MTKKELEASSGDFFASFQTDFLKQRELLDDNGENDITNERNAPSLVEEKKMKRGT
jgi:hypothetical protein